MPENYQAERMKILEMLGDGEISAEDGLQLLEALSGVASGPDNYEHDPLVVEKLLHDQISEPELTEERSDVEILDPGSPVQPASKGKSELEMNSWRGWWKYVFWAGAGVMLVGLLFLMLAVQFNAAALWFVCAGIPFFFGLFILLFGLYSRSSRWIHIRIKQQPGEVPSNIALSFPLPIRPTAWFIRVFRRWIPQLRETGLDELILALGESATPDNPLYVQVQDDEDGEQVEVYIG